MLTPALELSPDRKSTRLNSSHSSISYAVFCLKKKNYQSLWLSVVTQSDRHRLLEYQDQQDEQVDPPAAGQVRLLLFETLEPAQVFFFLNDTAPTEIYTLSLHDALPICRFIDVGGCPQHIIEMGASTTPGAPPDRKSTRLNSSHSSISYAVFCLKKK